MRLIQEAADRELFWRQPSAMKSAYELRAGEETLATLTWRSMGGSLATARTAEGAWTFKRSGFWQQRVTARPLDSEREVATFKPEWTGNGTLTLEGGRVYRWVSTGFWRQRSTWQGAHEAEIVGFSDASGFKTEGKVELSVVAAALPETAQLDDLYSPLAPEALAPPSAPLAELPLLVTLGWYLIVLAAQDAAGATVAAST